MAKKAKLPDPLIDFIRTHHGTTKVQYFYRSFIKTNPTEKIDEEKFCYPGPSPFTKETAVLMMADSVEAAARSLTKYDFESISSLVKNIIDYQIAEEQFSNASITFKDITVLKKLFIKELLSIYHVRVEYPKL
jgi:membrane-associated HD superfamily phosphohydrolase